MIDVKEHFYDDDPHIGHPDVRTVLQSVNYFFLGNGLIQAAVQWAAAEEGTPLGLLVMDPEVLGKKREALTQDQAKGLEATLAEVAADGKRFFPGGAGLKVRWDEREGLPVVLAEWRAGDLEVAESFSCPDHDSPQLVREIKIRNLRSEAVSVAVRTGVRDVFVERSANVPPKGETFIILAYRLEASRKRVSAVFVDPPSVSRAIRPFRDPRIRIHFGHPLLGHFFRSAVFQLPAAVSRAGRVDGSIWQYNREWLRDQAVVATALAMIGDRDGARTMFARLLDRFVTDEGDAIDSSERRAADEVELDQNGFLLLGLKDYVLWTGDLDLVRKAWRKVVAAAEFPLGAVFRHNASGLLMNRREFWERHRLHGIETGMELVHQLYTSAGLEAASVLAGSLGDKTAAERWAGESRRIRKAMLEDRIFRMLDNRGFIKRRGQDGPVQETIRPQPEAALPAGVPLGSEGEHYLNPDTSAVLPIVLGFIEPGSLPARLTLASMETLWNQAWNHGGYGRYHCTSEPDSAGPWPFPSLFVARAAAEAGDFANVWRILHWLDSLPGAAAGGWFEFYGTRLSPPFPQVGIIPWTWAEMIHLFIRHILGFRPEADGLHIRPRLLPGMGPVRADIPFRGARLTLEIDPPEEKRPLRFDTDGTVLRQSDGQIILASPERNIRIAIW